MATNLSSALIKMKEDVTTPSNTDKKCSQFAGLDAMRKLRWNYIINKVYTLCIIMVTASVINLEYHH